MSADGTGGFGSTPVSKGGPASQASMIVLWSLITSLFLVAAYAMMVVYQRL
jgi:hypothetical protein